MSYRETFNIRIFGGLPVIVEAVFQPAEPDVGIMGDYVDDWKVIGVGGVIKNCDWIERKLQANEGEQEKMIKQIYDCC